MRHDEIVTFARLHKDTISLVPNSVREELKLLDKEFRDTAPFIRDQKEFNERSYRALEQY